MTSEIGLFLAVFLAIFIGWVLGKFPWSTFWKKFRNRGWRKAYMEGIHLLLNQESDQAIETFLHSWSVSSDNFDLHNALANMLRRKGEVDRAIRIHANLIECEKLHKEQVRQASIELANDYIKAGLLDRAERLLINVVNSSRDFEERALELLQQIYELEKEWYKAIVVAEQLAPRRSVAFESNTLSSGKERVEIAHYYCEIAEEALQDDNFRASEEALDQALRYDARCARAAIIRAEMAYERGDADTAIRELQEVADYEPYLIVESLDVLERCYGDRVDELVAYLRAFIDNYPSSRLDAAIFRLMKSSSPSDADEFLFERVKIRPTLSGLDLLVASESDNAAGYSKSRLMHELVSEVLQSKPQYQCRSCGYSGNHMHWQCPQCHSWDTVRRIRGKEGD
ncbi:Lipopolysaccharide assembly protein B [BD1-7 clade bacterium]|uniref:Lipopolysaccharide assembly protein B n=1 Tax=BD1-7 clade bacterium TaxID=2029982 RepID=A0A5S9PA37_9GAMM|nr:Lipopolysaccharide assembly protein B [BD1-7 clade bacterium]